MPLWPQRWLRFMAKSELYWWPLTLVLDGAGAFQVHRGAADIEAIETAVRLAREGNIVVMFPEGTRRQEGARQEARGARALRRGADRAQAGVPLVPAAVAGTDRLLALGPLRVAYGAPIEIEDLARAATCGPPRRRRPTG